MEDLHSSHLINDIFATQDDEIQCEEAHIQIALSTDARLSDEDSRKRYPGLWLHFRFCPDCAEEYKMVQKLVELEATGELPIPKNIPPVPTKQKMGIWRAVQDIVTLNFPGFGPAVANAVTRGVVSFAEPVELALEPDALWLSLDLNINTQDAATRDLFCTLITAETAPEMLEGLPIWLHIEDATGPVLLEQTLNELGDVALFQVPPGKYALRLHFPQKDYVIENLLFP